MQRECTYLGYETLHYFTFDFVLLFLPCSMPHLFMHCIMHRASIIYVLYYALFLYTWWTGTVDDVNVLAFEEATQILTGHNAVKEFLACASGRSATTGAMKIKGWSHPI
jgi:hypothetical protein